MLSPLSPFYCAHCTQCRLPVNACVCAKIQVCEMPFNIMICSHAKEWQKMDNTAHWAFLSSPEIERIKWHRKTERINSTLALSELTELSGQYLLFPSDDAIDIQQPELNIERLWVVDGTWQEAQKMLRQSPWLNHLPKVKITSHADSQFVLRRNQRGLSTLEAIAMASSVRSDSAAQALTNNFSLFQNTLLGLMK